MSSKNKNRRREMTSIIVDKIPLVSVIIPMYNSAKFIPQTLESLLYQTMQDFEVVVVDDCSTDNSVEVVERFKEKFGGRLHIIKLKKNTGTPGLPRNVGIQYAHGKYIAFLDSDDLFTKTALEELSGLAEKFQADIVHTDIWFFLQSDDAENFSENNLTNLTNPDNLKLSRWSTTSEFEEPFLEKIPFNERLTNWIKWRYRWGTCSSFCRRDFLIGNQIFFSNSPAYEDMFFNFSALCFAEKYLRVNNSFYIVRQHSGSIMREQNTQFNIQSYFSKWLGSLVESFNAFEKFMMQLSFFQTHANYRYAVLEFLFQRMMSDAVYFKPFYAKIPAFKLNDLVKKEFHPDDAAFSAYLFNTLNIYRLQIMKLQQELQTLKNAK